ncbi:MAG TPA: hypothetical protein GX003_02620 [Acholeplasmataceae bacterium]|nr:hypothetical protein [Acholeplasmataceae bacterium]
MKRFKYLILVIILVFALSGCRVPEEEKPFDPDSVEVELEHKGNLTQIDENVTEVKFNIKHNQDPEKYTPSKITWNRNLIDVDEGEEYKYTPISGLLSKTDIYATVTFTVEGEEYHFKTDTKTIKVSGITASVEIMTTHPGLDGTIVDNVLNDQSTPIEFSALITGGYGEEELSWWIVNEETKEEVEAIQFRKNQTFTYQPSSSGLVRVEARLKGNKFISNKIYIRTSYGKLLLSGQVNELNQMEIVSMFNNQLEGTYSWEVLTQSKSEYEVIALENKNSITFDLNTLDEPKLVRAKFSPNSGEGVIVSEPVLVSSNYTLVSNELELLDAIANKAKAIKFTADIEYTKIDDPGETGTKRPIVINYPVTIIGDNYTLSSLGIFTFIEVRSNNVWFKDIKIDHSSRYNVLVSNSINGYYENVEFIRPGGGSDMLTPGAGLYAYGSHVIVKNIKITQGFNSGLRVEAIYNNDIVTKTANITILGKFEYKIKELVAPIVSVRSKSIDANITAIGFDEFVIPIGSGKMIRRWSNDAYGVKWQLQEPYKVQYLPGEKVDFSGIVINVRIGANETTTFGLDFVYLFLNMFKETGTIRITNLNDINNPISEYIIYGYDYAIGGDLLLYHDRLGNEVLPVLPETLGDYQVHIWVGDTQEGEGLYLGYIIVRIAEQHE